MLPFRYIVHMSIVQTGNRLDLPSDDQAVIRLRICRSTGYLGFTTSGDLVFRFGNRWLGMIRH